MPLPPRLSFLIIFRASFNCSNFRKSASPISPYLLYFGYLHIISQNSAFVTHRSSSDPTWCGFLFTIRDRGASFSHTSVCVFSPRTNPHPLHHVNISFDGWYAKTSKIQESPSRLENYGVHQKHKTARNHQYLRVSKIREMLACLFFQ